MISIERRGKKIAFQHGTMESEKLGNGQAGSNTQKKYQLKLTELSMWRVTVDRIIYVTGSINTKVDGKEVLVNSTVY